MGMGSREGDSVGPPLSLTHVAQVGGVNYEYKKEG